MCRSTERSSCQHQRMRNDQAHNGQSQTGQLSQRRHSHGKASHVRKPRQHRSNDENNNNNATNNSTTRHNGGPTPRPQDRLTSQSSPNNEMKHIDRPTSGSGSHQGKGRATSSSPRGFKRGASESPNSLLTMGMCHGPRIDNVMTPSKAQNNFVNTASVTTTPQKSQSPVYAGAKFSDPPSPKVLPKPPVHWVFPSVLIPEPSRSCTEMTNVLRVMLKVQA